MLSALKRFDSILSGSNIILPFQGKSFRNQTPKNFQVFKVFNEDKYFTYLNVGAYFFNLPIPRNVINNMGVVDVNIG